MKSFLLVGEQQARHSPNTRHPLVRRLFKGNRSIGRGENSPGTRVRVVGLTACRHFDWLRFGPSRLPRAREVRLVLPVVKFAKWPQPGRPGPARPWTSRDRGETQAHGEFRSACRTAPQPVGRRVPPMESTQSGGRGGLGNAERTSGRAVAAHPNSPPGVVRLPNKQLIFQTDSAVSAFSSKSQPASRQYCISRSEASM